MIIFLIYNKNFFSDSGRPEIREIRRERMIKKIIMILVLSVFALSSFSETAVESEKGLPPPESGKVKKIKQVKYDGIKYSKKKEKEAEIIEIQILSIEDVLDNKSTEGKKKIKKHYYLFHTKGTKDRTEKIKMFKRREKLIAEPSKPYKVSKPYKAHKNYVSIIMERGQKIKWICPFPFTIFYGGRSILTTDEYGLARTGQIISYLQAKKNGENWYQTPDAWIINNALNGTYKYFVSVYVPESDTVYVDDPETIVRPPE